jgi:rRNA maturation RNase YbeY
MSVYLRIEGAGAGPEALGPLVRRYAKRMLRALELEHCDLSLVVCDDRVMRRINRDYRQVDRPTDVLAFAMREGMSMPTLEEGEPLGDIVLAWPTIARQARAHRWSPEHETCLLLAHGLLHLLGFDHADRTSERRMMARTHLLMTAALPRRRSVDKPKKSPRKRSVRSPSKPGNPG